MLGSKASMDFRHVAAHSGLGGKSPDLPVPGKQKPIGKIANLVSS